MTRDLTRLEGIFVGGSGGAAVSGAIAYARAMMSRGDARTGDRPARILVILADAGHKYLSKIFNDDWMRDNGFLEDAPGLGTVRDVLTSREPKALVTARPGASLREVIAQMKTLGISQLPVVEDGKLRGIVAEVDLLRVLVAGGKTLDCRIEELMENEYATVTPNTKVELLQAVLADSKVAIVEEGERILGIVTQIDLIDFLARRAAQTPSVAPGAS